MRLCSMLPLTSMHACWDTVGCATCLQMPTDAPANAYALTLSGSLSYNACKAAVLGNLSLDVTVQILVPEATALTG